MKTRTKSTGLQSVSWCAPKSERPYAEIHATLLNKTYLNDPPCLLIKKGVSPRNSPVLRTRGGFVGIAPGRLGPCRVSRVKAASSAHNKNTAHDTKKVKFQGGHTHLKDLLSGRNAALNHSTRPPKANEIGQPQGEPGTPKNGR